MRYLTLAALIFLSGCGDDVVPNSKRPSVAGDQADKVQNTCNELPTAREISEYFLRRYDLDIGFLNGSDSVDCKTSNEVIRYKTVEVMPPIRIAEDATIVTDWTGKGGIAIPLGRASVGKLLLKQLENKFSYTRGISISIDHVKVIGVRIGTGPTLREISMQVQSDGSLRMIVYPPKQNFDRVLAEVRKFENREQTLDLMIHSPEDSSDQILFASASFGQSLTDRDFKVDEGSR